MTARDDYPALNAYSTYPSKSGGHLQAVAALDELDRLREREHTKKVPNAERTMFVLMAENRGLHNEIETMQKVSDADEQTMLVLMAENRRLRERIRAIVSANNAHATSFGRPS